MVELGRVDGFGRCQVVAVREPQFKAVMVLEVMS